MKKHKIDMKRIPAFYIVLIILFLFVAGVGSGIFIDRAIIYNSEEDTGVCLVSGELDEFISVYNSIIVDYYKEVDKNILVEGAIDGLLQSLDDPYTSYMDSDATNDFNLRMQGDYEGIGSYIGVNEEGEVIISQPFTDSPAEKAGLLPMDVIVEVDGVNVENETTDTVASLIRGEGGTNVILKIRRNEEEIIKTITRASIELHSVTFEMLDDNIGYIMIQLFSENSYEDFESALEELEAKEMESLIIDVRNNSGGYLGEVSYMLSEFLDKESVIYQLESRSSKTEINSFTSEVREYDVVVLVNGYSASASEILAAGLQEEYGATIVGITTFGKGLVQTPAYLDTGGMIKYSNEKWLTPDGNWIHEIGITPDYEIELDDKSDTQLEKAIDILN